MHFKWNPVDTAERYIQTTVLLSVGTEYLCYRNAVSMFDISQSIIPSL